MVGEITAIIYLQKVLVPYLDAYPVVRTLFSTNNVIIINEKLIVNFYLINF